MPAEAEAVIEVTPEPVAQTVVETEATPVAETEPVAVETTHTEAAPIPALTESGRAFNDPREIRRRRMEAKLLAEQQAAVTEAPIAEATEPDPSSKEAVISAEVTEVAPQAQPDVAPATVQDDASTADTNAPEQPGISELEQQNASEQLEGDGDTPKNS